MINTFLQTFSVYVIYIASIAGAIDNFKKARNKIQKEEVAVKMKQKLDCNEELAKIKQLDLDIINAGMFYMCVGVCMSIYVFGCERMNECMCSFLHCMYVCTYVCMYVCMYVYTLSGHDHIVSCSFLSGLFLPFSLSLSVFSLSYTICHLIRCLCLLQLIDHTMSPLPLLTTSLTFLFYFLACHVMSCRVMSYYI